MSYKKSNWGFCPLCYDGIYKLHTKKLYCHVFLTEYQIACCYRKVVLCLKDDDNPNIKKAIFHKNMKIPLNY